MNAKTKLIIEIVEALPDYTLENLFEDISHEIFIPISYQQAADLLGCTDKFICGLANRNKIAKFGECNGFVRVNKAELLRYVFAQRQPANTMPSKD